MRRWNKIIDPDDEEDVVVEVDEQKMINPLCKKCAERVDSSLTTRKDILCIYGLEPEKTTKEEGMGSTTFKCRRFNPITDLDMI